VHGDAHVWNVFLPNDDSAGGERLFDWSAWRPDLPATDLACMMAMHWYPERRRRFERPLFDHDYRLAVLTQLMTPIIWANVGIPPAVWWNNLERIMLAVDDLGCRDLLSP
jgi:hypothetical protein